MQNKKLFKIILHVGRVTSLQNWKGKVLPSKLDRFLSTIDVLWEKIAALIEFS